MEEDAPAGVPEWVVTYGDMMSLLLTFFIMLVSLSEVQADKKYRAILDAIQKRLGYRSGAVAPAGKRHPLNSQMAAGDRLGSFSNDEQGKGGIKATGPEGTDFRVFRRGHGTSVRVGEGLNFAPDSTEISPELEILLRKIALDLAGKPNKIDVRGHCRTSSEKTPSEKWTLTFERARNVADFLRRAGIEKTRITASGAGDGEPFPITGENQDWNPDRVEVLVLDTFTRDFAGERDIPD